MSTRFHEAYLTPKYQPHPRAVDVPTSCHLIPQPTSGQDGLDDEVQLLDSGIEKKVHEMERTRGLLERFEAPMIAQTEVELGLKEVRPWAGAAVVLESSRPQTVRPLVRRRQLSINLTMPPTSKSAHVQQDPRRARAPSSGCLGAERRQAKQSLSVAG